MMRKVREQRIGTVFVLIIFCVFAISVLMVLMLGANVYKNMSEISQDGQDARTVLSFIWTKVKNSDENGRISIGEFHSRPALFFDEEFDQVHYRTMIYHYDGWIYELFSEAALDFDPADGVQLIKTGDLSFENIGDGLIKVTTGGRSLLMFTRSVEAEALSGDMVIEGGGF